VNTLQAFHLKAADGKLIRGDRAEGKDRQILFITGFLSKRWGNKSKALAHRLSSPEHVETFRRIVLGQS
jgi:hypothetical protein